MAWGQLTTVDEVAPENTALMAKIHRPKRCAICGYYLTTGEKYAGRRCLDPGHWQAAGVLAPADFYPMARLTAQVRAELNQRSAALQRRQEHRPGYLVQIDQTPVSQVIIGQLPIMLKEQALGA
jgi:hypothetical protein